MESAQRLRTAREAPALRQRLRILRQRCDSESLLQVLQRIAPQRGAILYRHGCRWEIPGLRLRRHLLLERCPGSSRAESAFVSLSGPHLPPTSLSDSSVVKAESAGAAAVASPQQDSRAKGRCLSCKKRVGLTGFRCWCGSTFCGAHRYPEEHGYTFDFKVAGRDAIARANPIVKADKLQQRF